MHTAVIYTVETAFERCQRCALCPCGLQHSHEIALCGYELSHISWVFDWQHTGGQWCLVRCLTAVVSHVRLYSAVCLPPTASMQAPKLPEQPAAQHPLLSAAVAGLSALVLLTGSPASAEFRLPPISSDPGRCDRGYVGNTIGQASSRGHLAGRSKGLAHHSSPQSLCNGSKIARLLYVFCPLSWPSVAACSRAWHLLWGCSWQLSYASRRHCQPVTTVCLLLLAQANAVSDKLLDLRKCDYSGKNLSGKTLAGALLSETNLSNTNLQEAVLTKVSRALLSLGCGTQAFHWCCCAADAAAPQPDVTVSTAGT